MNAVKRRMVLPVGLIAAGILAVGTTAQTKMFEFTGPPSTGLGHSLDASGDVNGDGVPDIIAGGVSMPANPDGTVQVFSGANGVKLHDIQGENGSRFGYAVTLVPDVDGDGKDDMLIGEPLFDSARGRAYLYHSAGQRIETLEGESELGHFGGSVAGIGDLDGDGRGELLVGAPLFRPEGFGSHGKVYLYSGGAVAAGDPDPIIVSHFPGTGVEFSGSFFGHVVTPIGDVDADGFCDYAIGAPSERHPDVPVSGSFGAVHVISGRTHGQIAVLRGIGHADYFGAAIGGVGDVDADGFDDIVVGAPDQGCACQLPGPYAKVFSGRAMARGVGNLEIHVLTAPDLSAGSRFGRAVDGAGDVDADGVPDIIVSAKEATGGDARHGRLLVFSGVDGSVLMGVDGIPNERLGYTVSRLGDPWRGLSGDLNGDGRDDVVAGAIDDTGHPFNTVATGSVQVWSRDTLDLPGAAVAAVGTGCDGTAQPLELSATPPELGEPWVVSLANGPTFFSTNGVFVLSLPLPAPIPLGSGCTLFVHPTQTLIVLPITTRSRGTGSLTIGLQRSYTLAGARLAAQAALFGTQTRGPLGFDLSNGLDLTLGF